MLSENMSDRITIVVNEANKLQNKKRENRIISFL